MSYSVAEDLFFDVWVLMELIDKPLSRRRKFQLYTKNIYHSSLHNRYC